MSVEDAKEAAGELYKEAKFEEAIVKYSEALGLMVDLDPDDDDAIEAVRGTADGKMRAILLCNRSQCYLKVGEKVPEGIQSKEARKAFMKANMDAGLAAELAPDYAKAHYRKGLSLLGMPETQQRSKEAVMALQAALKCSDMSKGMAEEVKKVLDYAQNRRFDAVDMPENCCMQ